MLSRMFFRLLLCSLILSFFISCQNGMTMDQMSNTAYYRLKAAPASLSPFLTKSGARNLRSVQAGAFHRAWETTDPAFKARLQGIREISISPVETGWLRPVRVKGLTLSRQPPPLVRDTQAAEVLKVELRKQFALAFLARRNPRFHWVPFNTGRCLILELNLIELNPTSVMGNTGKVAGNLLAGATAGLSTVVASLAIDPAIELAFPGQSLRGSIAIEGRLRLPGDGAIVYQFADHEQDPLTLLSVRDYRPYSHAMHAITAWGQQFEGLSRRGVLWDTPAIRFNPL